MSKGGGKVKETAKERALAEIGAAQLADFKKRWLPVQEGLAKDIVTAGAPGSVARRQAAGKVGVDTAARFGVAQQQLDARAAGGNAFGSSAHKLGITGMAGDRATSAGLGALAADQAVDDQYVAGLGTVTALGRGEKAIALQGMSRSAAMSGRQAQADALQSLENRLGNYQLAGSIAGLGLGLYANQKRTPVGPGDDINTDPSSLYAQNGLDVGYRQ